VVAEVGPDGGTVALGGTPSTQGVSVELRIPPAALDRTVAIRITETTIPPIDELADWSPIYHFEPETLRFNVVAEVREFLDARIAAAESAGISRDRIAIDPGFGFGKRAPDNLALLRHLAGFASLRAPILVGLSRKSLLATLTGREVHHRLAGSVALASIAVLNGARIVRAHDVAATVDATRVAAAVAQGEGFNGT
jgi:dihydropteroate synthase